MIRLQDRIEIRTKPEQVWNWLDELPQFYRSWHPDHISYRVLHGSLSTVGSEVECQEYLHGKLHTMRFRVTKVVPNKRVEYIIKGLGRGAFETQTAGERMHFVAELDIGSAAPIIGWTIDKLFQAFFTARLDSMQQHMREEGQNLKTILEYHPHIQEAA